MDKGSVIAKNMNVALEQVHMLCSAYEGSPWIKNQMKPNDTQEQE
jgi:hypothetical protein